MKLFLKDLLRGKNTTTIKIEHDSTERGEYATTISNEIKALAILLGGYNSYGRNIDCEMYKEVKARFDECIYDMRCLVEETKSNDYGK